MRRIYQDEWHGIKFIDFAEVSSRRLADVEFYRSFYKYFLTRYHDWSGLDPEWLSLKLQTAEFLKKKLAGHKDTRILSVGCGLGAIEKSFLESGYIDLDVTEVAPEPLAWIKNFISPDRIFVGTFPQCIPQNKTYDLMLFLGVESFLNQDELITMLKNANRYLSRQGRCILVSWSSEPSDILRNTIFVLKEIIKDFFGILHIRNRGQFWGYSRKRSEFLEAMKLSGFNNIDDGMFVKKTRWDTYWIEGSK
ncbi:MAG: hypothetical protein A2987_00250 [Omnitrophica bacterium RIFCSPLOWO2_01_FULL_45_10]|nr:MAG: hypothetical protein A2987_00250 [Omnitrophica bacterium RIFCSPLOWO2_01_FULL_45_10]